jgi:ribosomal protein S18 acetylase RimI-like enzyme
MTGYRIRRFADADRSALGGLSNALQDAERVMESNRAHWPETAGGYADEIVSEMASRNGAIFVAESTPAGPEPKQLVGYVTCREGYEDDRIIAEPARHYLYVSDLYVADAWRGKGIASALLAAAEGHGRALKLDQVRIGALAANADARRAYAKAGFEDYEIVLRKRL